MHRKTFVLALLFLLVSVLLVAQQPVERIDLNVIHKLKTAEVGGGGGFGGGRGGTPRPVPIMETMYNLTAVSYTHLRAHETELHLVCRLLLE